MSDKILTIMREPDVLELTKLSKSTRYRLEKAGKFPKRAQLSPGCVGWLNSEIQEWVESHAKVNQPVKTIS